MMSKVGESLLKGAKEALDLAISNRNVAKTHKVEVPQKMDNSKIRRKRPLTR